MQERRTVTTTTGNGSAGNGNAGNATVNRRVTNSSRRSALQKQNNSNSASFHPRLITSQIIALQCLHYFLLSFLFQVNHVFYNTSITIDRIFTDKYIRLWHTSGWADICAIMIGAVVG